jgi:predicted RNA-binding protein
MQTGDWVIFYSPKLEYDRPEKCQCFTAIVRVVDDEVYQQDMGKDFIPFRRKVQFLPSKDVSILPLIDELTFIKDKTHWGAPFRFGMLQIPQEDFQLIASQMVEDKTLLER